MSRVLPLLLGLAACAADGEVAVSVYGEDFIEVGIPAEAMADGWSVVFDHFDVTVEEVTVGGVAFADGDPVDLTEDSGGTGHALTTALVPPGSHTGPSYAITRVDASGTATMGMVTKTFDWEFTGETHYEDCETTTDVTSDGGRFQVTVHADHFFYDSLVSEDPDLRFQALADADTDGDGAITRAELEATDVGAYDVGSEGDVTDLWAWLVAQNRTLGHVDGEGHCDAHSHGG
jgi:hypothetical protein